MSEKVGKKPKGKVRIEWEMCKSCDYCAIHCAKKSIVIGTNYNAKGYYHAEWSGDDCNGCGICALVCPEAIIEVWRD